MGELIAVAGTMGSVPGVFLTAYAIINNRTLKETSRRTEALLGKMDQRLEGTQALITTMNREHNEILVRIDQGQQESRKQMADAIRYLRDLIRLGSEKTRDLIGPPA